MKQRGDRIRLAVFFLLVLGAFAVFAVVVTGQDLWQRFDRYLIRYTDTSVGGLQIGGTVVYQGVRVGTIENIEIDPQDIESVLVTIEVEEGTPVKDDVRAQIVPVGITGLSQIELSGGTQEAEDLPPGSFIPADESTITQVTDTVQSVLTNIQSVLTSIDSVLAENRSGVNNLVAELELAARSLGSAAAEAESFISSAREGTDAVVAIVERELAAADVAGLSESVRSVTDEARRTVSEIDLLLLQNRDDISEAVEQLNDTLSLLNNFAFQINTDPSLLLRPQEDR
jgi:phospholipid/cholesterol/gamma-HCH transport system substrate-binding protein